MTYSCRTYKIKQAISHNNTYGVSSKLLGNYIVDAFEKNIVTVLFKLYCIRLRILLFVITYVVTNAREFQIRILQVTLNKGF